MEPIAAARTIWRAARRAQTNEERLVQFIGLASEWEDDPEHRDVYEREIRLAASAMSRAFEDWWSNPKTS